MSGGRKCLGEEGGEEEDKEDDHCCRVEAGYRDDGNKDGNNDGVAASWGGIAKNNGGGERCND